MFSPVINKNLNWEILTKNLVTFKRWYGIKDKKLWEFIFNFREVQEKPTYKGNCLKRWVGQFAGLRGGLTKKRRVVFLSEVYTPNVH